MFVVIAGDSGGALQTDIAAMGAALRGSTRPVRTWVDPTAGFAVAAASRGILPEDVFDTQPYVTPDLCFVADGRIDNRAELSDRLSLSHSARAELSDAALLLLAYRKWGDEAGNVLAGQYSFCALHRDSRKVVVAADHIGSSFVMYATVQGRLLVANQAGALLAHALLRNAPIDLDSTAALVASRASLGRTAFRDMRTLRGGHTLRWSAAAGATEHRWWHADRTAPIRYRDPREYVEHANALFAEAVRGCLRAVGPISATLSGGLDSSLVSGFAAVQLARSGGDPLALYTSVPEPGLPCLERPGWDASEADLVQAFVAMHPNTTHTLVSPGNRSALEVMRETHLLSRTPVRNTANQVWLRIVCTSAASRGSRVILTGERGNATASLDGSLLAASLLRKNPALAIRLMRVDRSNGGRPIWRPLLRQLLDTLHLQRQPVPYGQHWLQAATVSRLGDLLKPDLQPMRTRNGQVLFATVPVRTWGSDVFAHHGVEYRDPTADKRFIEMTLAFPVEAFLSGGRSRGLAREMGQGVVPDVIRLRRRRGAQVPEHPALIARDGDAYRAALRSLHASPASRENFRLDRAEAALEELCSGKLRFAAAGTLDRLVDVGLFWQEHGL